MQNCFIPFNKPALTIRNSKNALFVALVAHLKNNWFNNRFIRCKKESLLIPSKRITEGWKPMQTTSLLLQVHLSSTWALRIVKSICDGKVVRWLCLSLHISFIHYCLPWYCMGWFGPLGNWFLAKKSKLSLKNFFNKKGQQFRMMLHNFWSGTSVKSLRHFLNEELKTKLLPQLNPALSISGDKWITCYRHNILWLQPPTTTSLNERGRFMWKSTFSNSLVRHKRSATSNFILQCTPFLFFKRDVLNWVRGK